MAEDGWSADLIQSELTGEVEPPPLIRIYDARIEVCFSKGTLSFCCNKVGINQQAVLHKATVGPILQAQIAQITQHIKDMLA